MKKLIICGTGVVGQRAYDKLKKDYDIHVWLDNDVFKQGLYFRGIKICGINDVIQNFRDIDIVIAMRDYFFVASILYYRGLRVVGYYDDTYERILPWEKKTWIDIISKEKIYLYAGDLSLNRRSQFDKDMICLSNNKENFYTIKHDLRMPYPLRDSSVDFYQSEDVFEHIEKEYFVPILNEIYRILKPNAYLRLALPDYNSHFSREECFFDDKENVIFDPRSGGVFKNGMIMNGGHMWHPTYDIVSSMISNSMFSKVEYLMYFTSNGKKIKHTIKNNKGYISRLSENEGEDRDRSIIVDLYK